MATAMANRVVLALCIVAVVQRSFVEPAPAATATGNAEREVPDSKSVDEEEQLKDLKHSLGKTISVLKTNAFESTNINGHQEAHGQLSEEVNRDGKLLASVKQSVNTAAHEGGDHEPPTGHIHTEIDVPSRGIHTVMEGELGEGQQEVTENVERRASPASHEENSIENYKSFSGVQYSPLDMAEYVFWTGDEKGVTLSIEELLQDGLMSREEAIAFLQEIRYNLDYLQFHYSQQQRFHKHEDQALNEPKDTNAVHNAVPMNKGDVLRIDPSVDPKSMNDLMAKKISPNDLPTPPAVTREEVVPENNRMQLQQQQQHQEQQHQEQFQQQQPQPQQQPQQQPQKQQPLQVNPVLGEEDYDELLERLKVADFLYTEYSLEEVIYQLAKVMFSQSLTKGTLEAQESLQKFTSFLEGEAEKGHISRSLEKKVLDVLIASLTDTLTEHPQFLSDVHEGSAPSSQLLRQLVMMNPINKAQKAADGHQTILAKKRDKAQIADDKIIKQGPTGLETISKAT